MLFTKIPTNTFKQIQLNAGILVDSFDPDTLEIGNILGATTGGINFTATPSFTDYGEDIDNCPKNTMELKRQDDIEAKMSGTFATISASSAKMLAGAADIDSQNESHIIPRKDLLTSDFQTIWWVGDYSDVNTGAGAGFCAVKLMNALSTGGFQIQSSDKGKGQFAFEFTGHYSMNAQDTVPFEIYIQGGGEEGQPSIVLDKHTINLTDGDEYEVGVTVSPADATITWTSASSSVATVADGTITAEGEGSTIITATITVDGIAYSDTATVIVAAGE